MFMKSGTGILMNILLGIVGAALANWLLGVFGIALGWMDRLLDRRIHRRMHHHLSVAGDQGPERLAASLHLNS
jgi:hypothetical protein